MAVPKQKKLKPGLEVNEYPRQVKQVDLEHIFLNPEKLRKSAGKPYLIKSLSDWTHETSRNAIAKGFLRIEKDGKYSFTTNSFYDRNLLMVNGKTLCQFNDGGSKISTITLKKGLVEIKSVGYAEGREAHRGFQCVGSLLVRES